jgi:hypothetical protein
MTIEITDLSALDSADVQQTLDELIIRLQELNPTLDLTRRGPLKDLLVGLHATLSTAEQETLARYISARSLQQIEEDPTLADDDVVEDVLSNYRVTRQAGDQAAGEITIVMRNDFTTTISSGAIFEANGKQFAADSVFTAKAEAGQINSDTDRLIKQQSDGDYYFTITATAVEAGSDSLVQKDTAMIPASPPSNFVRSYATNDFVDGKDVETNSELIQRLQEGISCKAPSNRTNMKGMLRDIADEAYVGVIHSSLTGLGDEEMLRDQHAIWPGSLGGRADWYIRTQERLLRSAITKEATLTQIGTRASLNPNCDIGDSGATDIVGLWQLSLGLDDAPGFYEVRSILLVGASNLLGTFEILSDIRALDLTGAGFVPDIDTVEEGAYSRYQTGIFQFIDDQTDYTDLAVQDKQDYSVTAAWMPKIGDIQDDLNARDIRSYGSDVLVKAPVPVFLELSFSIDKQNNLDDPDLDAIKTALATEVNAIPFIGRLFASQLHDVIHGFLSDTTSAGRIDMFGRIRYPDGTTAYVRDYEVLKVDDPAGQMVSPKTVQFFLDEEDIAITIKTSIPVPS